MGPGQLRKFSSLKYLSNSGRSAMLIGCGIYPLARHAPLQRLFAFKGNSDSSPTPCATSPLDLHHLLAHCSHRTR